MKSTHVFWISLVMVIKKDAEEKDYVVDFLAQKETKDDSLFVYYKDDDQSAIYSINGEGREQIMQALRQIPDGTEDPQGETANVFWSELNKYYRMTI